MKDGQVPTAEVYTSSELCRWHSAVKLPALKFRESSLCFIRSLGFKCGLRITSNKFRDAEDTLGYLSIIAKLDAIEPNMNFHVAKECDVVY